MTEFPVGRQLRPNIQESSQLTVHGRNRHRVGVWEAEKDVEEHNKDASYAVDHKPCIAHPERPFGRVLSLAQKVRQDGQEIGHRREYDEAADQSVETCFCA
jgi:hypothetical protein